MPIGSDILKYFFEDANEYFIGAGSFLGVAISRNVNNKNF